jgi:hypothetical protein
MRLKNSLPGCGHGKAGNALGPTLIDERIPTPGYALFRWARFCLALLVCLGLWACGMGP